MASSAIRIDTDDFISPGLECVKTDNKVETGQKIEISLDDCLACSGCLTSAEEIMLQQHNTDEIVKILQNKNGKTVCCGISSQSLASLAVKSGVSSQEFLAETATLLKNSGVDFIEKVLRLAIFQFFVVS